MLNEGNKNKKKSGRKNNKNILLQHLKYLLQYVLYICGQSCVTCKNFEAV